LMNDILVCRDVILHAAEPKRKNSSANSPSCARMNR
jgi:hypothetical protein